MTDPAEALAVAAEVVDDMSRGLFRRKRGTAPERAHAALDIARFILDYDSAVDGDDVEPSDEVDLGGPLEVASALPVGPVRRVMCAAEPGDYAYCRAGKAKGRPFVGIEAVSGGDQVAVYLSLSEARSFAAGLLDAADEAEGGSPLLRFEKPE